MKLYKNLISNKREQTVFLSIFIGTFIAALLTFSPGSLFIISLAFLFGLLICRKIPDQNEKRFLLTIFFAGFLIRIFATLFSLLLLDLLGKSYVLFEPTGEQVLAFFGDGGYNTLRSWWIARYLLGETLSPETVYEAFNNPYGKSGFIYILSFFRYNFGFSLISSKFINCFLGTVTGVIFYFISKEIFTHKEAKLSAIFIVFFPSLFLWSLTDLKETCVIFVLSVIIWSFIKFQKSKKIYYLASMILALCFFATLRKYLGLFMILIVFLSFFLILRISLLKKAGILLIAFIALQAFLPKEGKSIKSVISQGLAQIVIFHRGTVAEGGSFYKLLDEKYYLNNPKRTAENPDNYLYTPADMNFRDYIKMFFKGWYHFLFEPLPWKIRTQLMLLSFPQIILWYILIPFAFLGMILAINKNWHLSIILFACLFIIGSLFAITGGNIGTIFRHRDMITPIFLFFAAAGMTNFLAKNPENK